MNRDDIKRSKLLSKALRHDPGRLGLHPDGAGWVEVDAVLRACAASSTGRGISIDRADLERVVATNDKQRFAFNDDRTRIRASQGHTIDVDLGLVPQAPPEVLFHGTALAFVESILRQGLLRGGRNHVHLSADVETAIKVGARHGKPYVFEVAATRMVEAGHAFVRSDNGVWLALHVPAEFLRAHGG
jgi:putative RNA 2'-phosphotransferase